LKPTAILITFASAIWLSQASTAEACVSVHLENESKVDISGFWGAQGCAGVYNKENPVLLEICKHHGVSSGTHRSYNYKWGTTAPTLWVTFRVRTDYGDYNQLRRYIFEHGRFRENGDAVPGTPSKCGRHYSVVFTQEEFLEEQNK